MVDEDPQNESWPQALKRAEVETKLQDRYAKAVDALQRSEWASAIDLLIEVLTVRPDYKDSASRLAEAVNKTRNDEEKPDPAPQPSRESQVESAEHPSQNESSPLAPKRADLDTKLQDRDARELVARQRRGSYKRAGRNPREDSRHSR